MTGPAVGAVAAARVAEKHLVPNLDIIDARADCLYGASSYTNWVRNLSGIKRVILEAGLFTNLRDLRHTETVQESCHLDRKGLHDRSQQQIF